mgnify:CR=1 FL=1
MNKYMKLIPICLLIIFCFDSLVYANDDLIEEKVEYLFKDFKTSNSKVTKNEMLEEIFKIDDGEIREELLYKLELIEDKKEEMLKEANERIKELLDKTDNNGKKTANIFYISILIYYFIKVFHAA